MNVSSLWRDICSTRYDLHGFGLPLEGRVEGFLRCLSGDMSFASWVSS